MRKELKKTDVEWGIFFDVFEYYKEYGIPENDKMYWDAAIVAGNKIIEKYNGNHLAKELSNGVLKALYYEAEEVKK